MDAGQVTTLAQNASRVARCGRACLRLFSDCSGLSKKQLVGRFVIALIPCVVMLILMIFISVYPPPPDIRLYGIVARTALGLIGLVDWPFLHLNWSHLASNIFFVLALGFLIAVFSPLDYVLVFLVSQFVGGFFVWVSGPSAVSVIGASGVVMGFFAAIIVRAIFERSWYVQCVIVRFHIFLIQVVYFLGRNHRLLLRLFHYPGSFTRTKLWRLFRVVASTFVWALERRSNCSTFGADSQTKKTTSSASREWNAGF
jgi:membrane associated rhomboid family serine protease